MNYKLVAAFGIALMIGCGASRTMLVPDGIANAGGMGGAGGSGGDPGCTCEAPDLSGARLKVAYIEGADGSKANVGLFDDTQLGTICSFRRMPNGDTYCVPDSATMNAFLDAECKVPVYVVKIKPGQCTPLPTFAEFDELSANGCPLTFTGKFRIGSANTSKPLALTKWYTFSTPDGCIPMGFSQQLGETVAAYELSLLGTQDDFVKAAHPQEP